ncbi:MAG: hypothetical protein O3A92_13880, partial [Verrucomicrobia bacterium]|nr:hypothetical protein [Verrucomicrobiota bacterium]
LRGCGEKESAKAPSSPPPTVAPAADAPDETQGLAGFFAPKPGESWTYEVHRDLPPDTVLNDDDQLRSSSLPGGGFRFTNERHRLCEGVQSPPESDTPLTVLTLSENGIPSGTEYLDIGPQGMVARGWKQAGTVDLPLQLIDPGILLAAPGMTGGQTWTSTGTSTEQTFQFRVIERTKLTVPAGTYETVRLQMNSANDSKAIRRTLWFAENVGIIKEESIYYDNQRITVRETSVLTAWSTPGSEPATETAPSEPEESTVHDEVTPFPEPIAWEQDPFEGELEAIPANLFDFPVSETDGDHGTEEN